MVMDNPQDSARLARIEVLVDQGFIGTNRRLDEVRASLTSHDERLVKLEEMANKEFGRREVTANVTSRDRFWFAFTITSAITVITIAVNVILKVLL